MGESGKETISAESPIHLPEAMQAIRSGKLPRKMGMTLIRDERQFDLVLQPETFSISGGKIHVEDDEEFGNEERIDAIRTLSETTDMMFHAFCAQRVSDGWKKQHQQIHRWLSVEQSSGRKAA